MKSCCKDVMNEEDDAPEDKPQGAFNRLKAKWEVKSTGQLLLILCTFALGGTACGMVGRKIMHYIGPDHKGFWIVVYILLVTILWPLCVIIISIPLGQFNFFRNYLKRLGRRIFGGGKKSGF